MKYKFNEISCYYSKGEKLFFLPKGEFIPFGGAIDIEPVLEVNFPLKKEVLEQKINECFSLCWSKKVKDFPKVSIIGQYLNIKGFKKIVQKFDFFELKYIIPEKKYELWNAEKAADFKSYRGGENIEMGSDIDFDFIMNLVSL